MGQRVSKQEIPEKFLVPQSDFGLDSSKVRQVRKLVIRGKLAPFYPGKDDPGTSLRQHDECPICFLQFHSMNRSVCCGQRICSECYIRIGASSRGSYFGSTCPFCKASGYIVELCAPKSEKEKAEESMDEERVLACRLREQMNEDWTPVDGIETSQFNFVSEVQVDSSIPVDGDNRNVVREDRGTTPEANNRYRGALSLIEDEYREEYEALRWRQRSVVHNMSTTEIQQCEDYLGVFPEDLGLQLEDFNELMLEQVLASSAFDIQDDENNDNSSQASTDVFVAAQPTDDPSGSQRRDTPHPVTGRLLFRTTNAAQGLSFDSPTAHSADRVPRRDSCPSPCDVIDAIQQGSERTGGAGQGMSICEGSLGINTHIPRLNPLPHTERDHLCVWKTLIAKLALNGEVDSSYKTPHIGMVFCVSMGESPPAHSPGGLVRSDQCVTFNENVPSFVIFERMRVDDRSIPGQERGLETAAVENPDGSLMLVRIQREPRQDESKDTNDSRIMEVIAQQDAEVRNAVSQGDAGTSTNRIDEQIAQSIGQADQDFAERMRIADEELRRRLHTSGS